MRTWERRLFNAAAAGVALTGFAYLWMKYVLKTDDPFALVNHPWQGAVLAWHLVLSPVLVLAFGIVLNSHVMKKLRVTGTANGPTGYASLVTFLVMVLSGYVLQVITSEPLLWAVVIVHIASGSVFTLAYAAHLVIAWRLSRSRRRAPLASVA